MKNIVKIFTFLFIITNYLTNNSFSTTLQEALNLAYNNSETVYMKSYQKDLSKIDSYKSFANFLPSATLTYSYMPISKFNNNSANGSNIAMPRVDPATLTPFEQQVMGMLAGIGDLAKDNKYENSHSFQAGVTASLSYYKTIPAYMASRKNVDANRYEYDEFLENFGLLFIQKYMDVIYYTKAKEVYEQMSETYDKKLKRVMIMNKYGTAKRDKVVLAEAQLYENKANVININSSLDKAKMDYKIMTGQEPINLEMPDILNSQLPAENKDDFISLVLSSNSNLKKVEKQYEAQKYAKLGYLDILPDIFVSYTFMKMKSGGYNIQGDYVGLGASFAFNGRNKPILQSVALYKNYRIAELNKILKTKELEQEASYNWEQYFAMIELVKATEKALKASTDSLKEVKIALSTGTATFIDEMDIETQYLNANLNYLNAQKSLILSYYKLISMTGVGKIPVK